MAVRQRAMAVRQRVNGMVLSVVGIYRVYTIIVVHDMELSKNFLVYIDLIEDGKINKKTHLLLKTTYECLLIGIKHALPGNHFGDIGFEIQKYAECIFQKFKILRLMASQAQQPICWRVFLYFN